MSSIRVFIIYLEPLFAVWQRKYAKIVRTNLNQRFEFEHFDLLSIFEDNEVIVTKENPSRHKIEP